MDLSVVLLYPKNKSPTASSPKQVPGALSSSKTAQSPPGVCLEGRAEEAGGLWGALGLALRAGGGSCDDRKV